MSWDNPSDLEMGYETRIGRRVFKTADPPQCTGCEHVNADNEPDDWKKVCQSCKRNPAQLDGADDCVIRDNYSLSGPDEPEENESEEV